MWLLWCVKPNAVECDASVKFVDSENQAWPFSGVEFTRGKVVYPRDPREASGAWKGWYAVSRQPASEIKRPWPRGVQRCT